MPLDQRARTIDFLGVVASFSTALTGGNISTTGTPAPNTAGYFDTGGGRTVGDLTIDVSYASLASMDNAPSLNYEIHLQGAASSSFATPWVNLAAVDLGPWNLLAAHAKTNTGMPLQPQTDGSLAVVPIRVTIPFTNDLAGTSYRYLRTWCRVGAGATIVTGIVYKAYITKRL